MSQVTVAIPKLGLTMTEATILEVRRGAGDRVAAGETLMTIETEKAEVDIESPVSGRIVAVLGEEEGVYPIGEVVAVIEVDE